MKAPGKNNPAVVSKTPEPRIYFDFINELYKPIEKFNGNTKRTRTGLVKDY